MGHLIGSRRCSFAEEAALGRPQLNHGHDGCAARRRGAWWVSSAYGIPRGCWFGGVALVRGRCLRWQWEPTFGTKGLGLLGLRVISSTIITASAQITIFRAQQRLLGILHAILGINPVPGRGYMNTSKSILPVPSYSLSAPCSNSSCATSWCPCRVACW